MKHLLFFAFALFGLTLTLRAAPANVANISGKWHFVLDTPGGDREMGHVTCTVRTSGDREMDAVFQLNGDKVTGKWGTADVSGTFSDGKLTLSFPYTSDESGERDTLKITGDLRDDKLIGDWQFGGYNGTYKATPMK